MIDPLDAAKVNERIRQLMASNAELVAALREFLSITAESANFESALLDQPDNFSEFVDAQQKRVDAATEAARAALANNESQS